MSFLSLPFSVGKLIDYIVLNFHSPLLHFLFYPFCVTTILCQCSSLVFNPSIYKLYIMTSDAQKLYTTTSRCLAQAVSCTELNKYYYVNMVMPGTISFVPHLFQSIIFFLFLFKLSYSDWRLTGIHIGYLICSSSCVFHNRTPELSGLYTIILRTRFKGLLANIVN